MKLSNQSWLVAVALAATVTVGCLGAIVTLTLDEQIIPDAVLKLFGMAGGAFVGLLTSPRNDDSKPA